MEKKFAVLIENSGEVFRCDDSQNLLNAMATLGYRGIPVGCRGGGCGVCKVRVNQGTFHTRKMSRACISEEEERAGVVLACRLFPKGDLSLSVVGKLQKVMTAARA